MIWRAYNYGPKDMEEEINKKFIMEGSREWRMGEDEVRCRVHRKYIQC